MDRSELGDLMAFLAVAEKRSFTRAAADLGTSQSALSHTVRRLEERLGIRLLNRTTRSVAPTQAGERLAATLRPSFDEIDETISAIGELRESPSGTIRITTNQHAAETVLWPALQDLLSDYPELGVELSIDPELTDIVPERFDAGVRLGEQVARDMIAVRVGPDLRMVVVGAPSYFADHPKPMTPRDLTRHQCINLRLPTLGGLYPWELEKDGREINVRVSGRITFNEMRMVLTAATSGAGLAFVMEDQAEPLVASGELELVLDDWCPTFPGYHLFYPSRREPSRAFSLLVEVLRRRGRT